MLEKVNQSVSKIRAIYPHSCLRASVLQSEHLIKIKIKIEEIDVPLQSYVNENCNINWRMNPFGK